MTRLPWFSKVVVLALLQGCLAFLAARSYDRHHDFLAWVFLMALPAVTGFVARRRLALSLQGTLISYAVLPFLAAAYFRGIPGLILQRSAVVVLILLAPTALAWWLSGRGAPPVLSARR